MNRVILSLSTYPTAVPRQGGQKRIAAFRDAYAGLGIDLVNACIFERPPYTPAETGPYDLQYAGPEVFPARWPHLGDLRSGQFAAQNANAFAHFRSVIEKLRPVALQLEQPFLWPLVARLRDEPQFAALPLIYASQNWEGPLKASILMDAGVSSAEATGLAQGIEGFEAAAARAADLVIAVTASDAARYQPLLKPGARLVIVPNGTSRPQPAENPDTDLAGRRYALSVGSAYPPNIDGAAGLIFAPGLWFMPPEPSLAICGAMAYGVFGSDAYQDFVGAHDARTRFHPEPSDADLVGLIAGAHMILLPIRFGGGSNLKTAEALAAGCHVVATPTALRGFEAFAEAPGVHIGADAAGFHAGMIAAWNAPKLVLSTEDRAARDVVYWDRCLPAEALAAALDTIGL